MLTVLMKDIFVFSCGILIGVAFAFEVFQNQLQKEINYHNYRCHQHHILRHYCQDPCTAGRIYKYHKNSAIRSYITKYGWEKNNEIPNTNRPPRKR